MNYYVWRMYGECMAYVWLMFGVCMAYVWRILYVRMYGVWIMYEWLVYYVCMAYVLCMYGVCIMYIYSTSLTFKPFLSKQSHSYRHKGAGAMTSQGILSRSYRHKGAGAMHRDVTENLISFQLSSFSIILNITTTENNSGKYQIWDSMPDTVFSYIIESHNHITVYICKSTTQRLFR